MLNRKWIDKDTGRKPSGEDEVLTDEEDVDRADNFEKQYNFRYEEAYVVVVVFNGLPLVFMLNVSRRRIRHGRWSRLMCLAFVFHAYSVNAGVALAYVHLSCALIMMASI